MEFTRDDYLKLYRNMVLSRKVDEAIIDSMAKGKIRGFHHSGFGQEAQGVGACTFLRPDDFLMHNHRGNAHLVSKGFSLPHMYAEMFGRKTGYSQGKGGTIHMADIDLGIIGLSGTIGGCFPLAAGMGIAAQMNGRGQVVVCLFGDGTSNRGTLHEAFNLSMVWKLPIIWICENNGFAMAMRVERSVATKDIAALASGYDMPAVVIDGNDVLAVAEATVQGVERARAGAGPCFIECKTYRIRGHGVGDQASYRSAEEVEAAMQREPMRHYTAQLMGMGILTDADIERIDKETDGIVADALRFADEGPEPDPEEALLHLYAE